MNQERQLNSFHMRGLRIILGIIWQDKISINDVLKKADVTTVFSMISLRILRWLGQAKKMEDSRILKDLVYDEVANE
jgi:hypothetical protein